LKLLILTNAPSPTGDPYRKQFRQAGLDHREAILVHGIATHLTRGFRFPHAWVEVGEVAIDVSRSVDVPVYVGSKDYYYRLGKIRAAECRRYPLREALRQLDKHRHWGPWQPLPADVQLGQLPGVKEAKERRRAQ
jgi:hypothetical protein